MIVGTAEFWNAYDIFFEERSLKRFIEDGQDPPLADELRSVLCMAQINGELGNLCRTTHGWNRINGWFAGRSGHLFDEDGHPLIEIRRGDVIVVTHKRNNPEVIITHCPPPEYPRGAIFSGMRRWLRTFGMFIPLFSRETILSCINLRLAANYQDTVRSAFKEANMSQWP